jgi:thiamine-phosphate pyrophosphorylase
LRRVLNRPLVGLYPILDSRLLPLGELPNVARILQQSGVQQIQLRMKKNSDADRLRVQDAVATALEGSGTLVVVNDRADLARMLHQEAPDGVRVGLHLGQDDMDPARARDLLGDEIHISWSTHSLKQVEASAGLPLDGIAYGPVFGTKSKDDPEPAVGIDALRRASAESPWPVTAIGGIDAQSLASCLEAGASSVAVIGALFAPWDASEFRQRLDLFKGGFV